MTTYTGPCQIDCQLRCDVPEGVSLTAVPRPRHNWGGMAHCPNIEDGCELSFLSGASSVSSGETEGRQ